MTEIAEPTFKAELVAEGKIVWGVVTVTAGDWSESYAIRIPRHLAKAESEREKHLLSKVYAELEARARRAYTAYVRAQPVPRAEVSA